MSGVDADELAVVWLFVEFMLMVVLYLKIVYFSNNFNGMFQFVHIKQMITTIRQ